MTGAFNIARVGGIDIEIHYTWVIALLLVAWSLAAGYFLESFPGFEHRR